MLTIFPDMHAAAEGPLLLQLQENGNRFSARELHGEIRLLQKRNLSVWMLGNSIGTVSAFS